MTAHDIARSRLTGLIKGYCVSQAIGCAVELRLADLLADRSKTIHELALESNCSAPHLRRLLLALCSIGVFAEVDGYFKLTAMSNLLRRDADEGVWTLADFHCREMYAVFGNLLNNVRSGAAAWQSTFGMSAWEYFAAHQERGAVFDSAMKVKHERELNEMVAGLDLGAISSVVDIGGGDGSLLQNILSQHPKLRGVLFDAPAVVSRAQNSALGLKHLNRCSFIGGNVFHSVPAGHDVYVLSHVLHDWSDEECIEILQRCKEAMCASSRLWIIESVVEVPQSGSGAWADLGVMVFGGRERTLEEYEYLAIKSGLFLTGCRRLSKVHLLEATTVSESH